MADSNSGSSTSAADIATVVERALALSTWSFVVFAALTLLAAVVAFRKPSIETPPGQRRTEGGISDPAPIADALAKLVSALNAAGPPLIAILASLSFMLIAALYAPPRGGPAAKDGSPAGSNSPGGPSNK
jgi:hypothetical protein